MKHITGFGHDDGAGELVECVRHGLLPAFGHMNEIGEPPQRAHGLVGFQRAGGVAAFQSVAQRIRLGLQGDDLRLRFALPVQRLVQRLAALRQLGLGPLKSRIVLIARLLGFRA